MYCFIKEAVYERAVREANYIVQHGATIRETACVFGISKSTVHKDVTYELRKYNSVLAMKVANILAKNKAERHIRGGIATKIKYKQISVKKET